MKAQKDWLNAVELIGAILILTPIFAGLIFIILKMYVGLEMEEINSSLMFIFAGYITILYASIKRFMEGVRSGK